MKKNFIYALMSAIALTGAASFSACSSSDEIVDNPNYDSETNTVKTQLAISLQDNIANTRMSADATQAAGTVNKFLGMKNIKLIPYNATAVTSSTPILNGTILDLNDIPSSSTGTGTESNTVYTDVAVPVFTDRFLLYGSAGQTAGFENGNLAVAGLSSNTATDVSGVSFTPVPICSDVTTTSDYRKFKNILQLLNRVANSSVTSGTTTETWAPGANQTTVASLASLYTTFTSVTVGSSEYVKYLLQYLYNGINSTAGNSSAPGYALAKKIQDNILLALTYDDGGQNISCSANTFENGALTLASDYDGYPTNLNLPHGSIRISFFGGSFVDASNSSIGTLSVSSLGTYAYPANLQYFVESDILTSDSKVLNGSISTFATAKGLYGTSPGTSVSPSTRSILLNQQIQYGVGRLQATVNKLNGTKYFDRDGNEITIPVGGYTLKGILIGDQKTVEWNFVRSQSTLSLYTIYDKMIAGSTTGSAVTTSANSAQNHTLVLETEDDAPINVALEFVNTGSQFVGADGIVPSGATFYLIGTLTPSSTDSNYGEGPTKTKKVFAQDFVTTANFTIGTGAKSDDPSTFDQPDGFGKAVVGLPDLRQPQMELGLSVDLSWKSGLTFNVDL